jgi:hypothetical protein
MTRRPTGRGNATGARRVRRVTMYDAVTRDIVRMYIESEGGRAMTRLIVLHADWVRIGDGTDTLHKADLVPSRENAAAIAMLVRAGGREVRAWLGADAKGGMTRETITVPEDDASTWTTMRSGRNTFLTAVVPRVRHRILFFEGVVTVQDVDAFLNADTDDADADAEQQLYAFDAQRGDNRCVEATATIHDAEIRTTVVVQQVKQTAGGAQFGMSMYARDNTKRLRADERTLNAVNAYSWDVLMPLIPALTRVTTPVFISVPRTRAEEWTLETTTARNADLRSLLASGVRFREINERFVVPGGGNVVAAPEAEAAPEARRDD